MKCPFPKPARCDTKLAKVLFKPVLSVFSYVRFRVAWRVFFDKNSDLLLNLFRVRFSLEKGSNRGAKGAKRRQKDPKRLPKGVRYVFGIL